MRFVLLPGLDGTGELFTPLSAAFGDVTVIAYPPGTVATYEELTTLVLAALPREPFVLVAESFSGPIALEVAARRPTGLVALVLVATFARAPIPGAALLRPLVGAWLFQRKPPALLLRLLLVGLDAPDKLVRHVERAIARVGPRVLAARLRSVLAADAAQAASRCTVPLLYIQATQDRLVAVRSAHHLRSLVPQLVLRRVTGPHLVLQANPHAAAEAIRAFLAAADPGDG